MAQMDEEIGVKRDYRKDHMLRRAAKELRPKESLAELVDGAGQPMYSKLLKRLMPAEKVKRIGPNSDEGKAIAARFNKK